MTDSGYSQQDPEDSASDWAARQFQINQTLARVRTMVLVQVKAVQGGGGAISATPTVTVQPLVKLIDGQGNASSHGTLNNIPVFRLGGGKSAAICDPEIDDIGWMAVADRDISSVKANKGEANPGSRRKFDMADGVYMGSILSGIPEQYITFTSNGVTIADKNSNTIKMESDGINLNGLIINREGQVAGNLPVTGALELAGSIEALAGGTYGGNIATSGNITAGSGTGDSADLLNHTHSYLRPSSGATTPTETAKPTAGT